MKRFRPTEWPRAIVSPISSIFSQAVDGLSGKHRRKVQMLKAALETAETECDRLREEMQELVQYTDHELAQLKQDIEHLTQERDDLQVQVLILQEELDAANTRVEQVESSPSLSAPGTPVEAALSPQNTSFPDLSGFRLALVGGHPTTRRGVIEELRLNYGLKHFVEIPRMSEANTSRNRVKSKIHRCTLVVLITGYMSHRLTEIVFSLKDAGALAGDVLQLNCKGKSGVLRGILEHVEHAQG